MPRPLDALLLKTQAGLDDFVTEKYADEIAAIFAQWSSGLLQSPQNIEAIEEALAPNFTGSSLWPAESKVVRAGPSIEVRHNTFNPRAALRRDEFLQELRSTLNGFSKIVTTEFQVTNIDAGSMSAKSSSGQLQTRVRYELVATGNGFYREQRLGYWQIAWDRSAQEGSASGELRLRSWQTLEETQSRSTGPGYIDIAGAALGGNPSYSSQSSARNRLLADGARRRLRHRYLRAQRVSVGDIDSDGFDDLYVCQPAGLPNRLYRNRGDGTFEDITEASGVGILENTACALCCRLRQ